jgi:hypothetical protein
VLTTIIGRFHSPESKWNYWFWGKPDT